MNQIKASFVTRIKAGPLEQKTIAIQLATPLLLEFCSMPAPSLGKELQSELKKAKFFSGI